MRITVKQLKRLIKEAISEAAERSDPAPEREDYASDADYREALNRWRYAPKNKPSAAMAEFERWEREEGAGMTSPWSFEKPKGPPPRAYSEKEREEIDARRAEASRKFNLKHFD